VSESDELRDPRAMDDEEMEQVEMPPTADGDDRVGSAPTAEEEYAQGRTNDPDGAHREEPAGEDYAGSGF